MAKVNSTGDTNAKLTLLYSDTWDIMSQNTDNLNQFSTTDVKTVEFNWAC